MAKKILSILCALAMMVTMVSVAAFSASADGEANSTTINLLSSENIGNWNVVRAADNNWSLFSGAVGLSAENINGITGALSLIKTNCNVNPYVDFNYSQTIDFGTDFSILMTDYIKTNVGGTAPTDNSYIALTLGNYSIHLVRFAEDVATNSLSSWDCAEFRVALYKNDSLVKKSELIASATTTTLTDAYSSFSSGTAAGSVALKNGSPAGDKTTYVSSGAAYTRESAWKDIKITVKNGTLTVYDAKNTVLLTEDVSDSSFDGIKPSVRFYADSTLMKNNPIAVFRFEATINTASTGGETPDPEVPTGDVNFNLLNSTNITGWNITRSCPNDWTAANFAGNIDMTSLDPALVGITGALVHNRANSAVSTSVTFDYNNGVDAIDFGENFSVLMTAYMHTQPSGLETPDQDAYVSLKLGDYSVRLVHFVEDAANDTGWNQRDSFRIAVYNGETLVAVSDVIDRSVTTSLYNGAVYTSNEALWKSTGTYGNHIRLNSIGANKSAASGGVSFAGDAAWKDIEIVVNDNKMTIKTAAGVCGLHVLAGGESADDVTALSGFNTTSLDVAEGTSFDGIVPKVVLNVDGTLRKNQAVALFRLEGTIYAPEDSGETVASPEDPKGFLSINDSLALNFTLGKTDAGYSNIAATATIGDSPVDVKLVTKTLADGEHNVAVIDSLTPDQFGTEVVLNVTATKGGQQVTGTMTYSVKNYCENMMGKDTDLDNLCAYILKYGEAVRVMNGGAGNSITAGVDFSGIDTSLEWTAEGKTNNYGISSANGTVSWNSGNLNLADNIGINFTFTLPAGADIDDYNLFVDVVDAEFGVVGGDIESITPLGNNKYRAVARVYAYDMDKDVTAVVKDINNDAVSSVFTSGVQNYILEAIENDKFDDNELAVAEAMMTFGNAAAAYKAAN